MARRAVLATAAVNAVGAAVIHGPAFVRHASAGLGAGGVAWLAVAVGSQIGLACLAGSLPALIVATLPPLQRLAPVTAALGLALVQAYLQLDRTLLAVLGIHVDARVVELLLTPGGIGALDMQPGERWRIAAGLAGLLAAEVLLAAWIWRRARGGSAWPNRLALGLMAATALLFGGERAAYAVSAGAGWTELGRAAAALPAHGLETSLKLRLGPSQRLRLPRGPVATHPVAHPPSLVMIVIESWRADGLDPATTPALWRFSQGSLRFTDHRSGGNWTYAGVFTLFYGLHGAYAAAAQQARRGPVLFGRLRELGYQIKVVASRSTRFPRFRDTVFAALTADEIEDDLPGEDSAVRDREAARRALRFVAAADPTRPFALVVFLDAPHLPYAFAADSIRYRPYAEQLHYTEMTDPMPPAPIRNRYLNALVDVDRTAGALLGALESGGHLARAAVVVTGDHGQEFYEHGALGHNIAFTPEQTAVPLVLRLPGVDPGVRTALSRHVDVAPTLLSLLGVEGPWESVAQGRPLLDGPPAEHAVVCGYLDCAVIDADGTTTAFRPGDPLQPVRVWDGAWRALPPQRASGALPRVRQELRDFLE